MVDMISDKQTISSSEVNGQLKINIDPETTEDNNITSFVKVNSSREERTSVIPELKFRDLILAKKFGTDYDTDRVHVEFFSNEKSIKERLRFYFINDRRTSIRIRIFNFIIKLLTCILYVVRAVYDDSIDSSGLFKLPDDKLPSTSCHCWNRTEANKRAEDFRQNPCINWDAIIYTSYPVSIYISQVIIAIISYSQTLLIAYLTYKGNLLQTITKTSFLLDTLSSFMMILTLCWPPLRYLWVPTFVSCWLAKKELQQIFNDFHRASLKVSNAIAQRLLILTITLICLAFIGSSSIQHLQRGGNRQFNMFESIWYIVVTLTTVGYGDIYPDIWPSQLFMICLIILAFAIVPSKLEQLALMYLEKQKHGSTYSRHRAETERHVVVCSTTLHPNIIMDFLNEFYAHPMLQNYYVIILSPSEMNPNLKQFLQVPMWSQRVIYIHGSVLNSSDLQRAQMECAEACFILACRNYSSRDEADQHTIVRSWAVKDYAPNCVQYVHVLKPESKLHLEHAKCVVVEEEMKYALLAINCLCPGLSTFMTLLLHTSRGKEGAGSNEEWQKVYGKCSGNEIYHVKLEVSKFFKEYENKSFTYASFHSHRKFGVALIGIQEENGNIKLNPGSSYIMKPTDTCFYMSLSKEENSSLLIAEASKSLIPDEEFSINLPISKKISFRRKSNPHIRNPNNYQAQNGNVAENLIFKSYSGKNIFQPDFIEISNFKRSKENLIQTSESNTTLDSLGVKDEADYIQDLPPNPPYVGCSRTICHLVKKQPELCCLKLNQICTHSKSMQISDYKWRNNIIIIAAQSVNVSMYNFIVPLRSYSLKKYSLNPILLLLENEPDETFLEIIKSFPLVYWMKGSINSLEDLLKAGINEAEYLIVINKENCELNDETGLNDAQTIMAVQYIFRMFPKVKICSEIIDSNNMRFVKFKAHDHFSQQISKREKIERMKGSQIAYLFRLPFASGSVFSAAMLDTLLYQSFIKPYLINIVRLMIGIDQAPGSGHLSSRKISLDDSWIRTYGRFYQNLCSTTCDIPIGIYRTESISHKENYHYKELSQKPSSTETMTNSDIEKIVKTRMENLKITRNYHFDDEGNEFSYVIINPAYDLNLKVGDIVLLISPDNNIIKNG